MSRANFTSKFVPHDMERLLMKLAAVSTRLLNGLAFFLLLAMVAFSGAGLAEERAQPNAPEATASVDEIKAALDEAESVIDDATVTAEKLAELRQKIGDLASTLREKLGEIEPRAKEVADRLKQLGPAPPKDGPAESHDVADERKELTADSTELDGEVKAARLLLLRAEQLSERVSEKRHILYARELFARTQSILDPRFWLDATNALPVEWRRFDGLVASWQESVGERMTSHLAGASLSLITILLVIYSASRWVWPLVEGSRDSEGASRAWRVCGTSHGSSCDHYWRPLRRSLC
jgi:small-conductance mechanosensitive channel